MKKQIQKSGISTRTSIALRIQGLAYKKKKEMFDLLESGIRIRRVVLEAPRVSEP